MKGTANQSFKIRYRTMFLNILESENKKLSRQNQQRRPKLIFLMTILMAILMTASLASSILNIIVDESSSMNTRHNYPWKHEKLVPNRAQEVYHRQILVLENDIDYHYEDEYNWDDVVDMHEDDTADIYRHEWSPSQIEEMKKYYQRYLDVFFKTHGDEYEPEDKETVYIEYLAYLDKQNAKPKGDSKKLIGKTTESTEHGVDNYANQENEDIDCFETTSTTESPTTTRSSFLNGIIVEQNPYNLEMNGNNFEKVGRDPLNSTNNYTGTIKGMAKSVTRRFNIRFPAKTELCPHKTLSMK